MINDIEIMSPVGSWEALAAALQAGAGSVYFGVGELNMRSKSTFNFTLGDLRTIAGACRRGWVSTQLTGVEIVAGMCIECPAVNRRVDCVCPPPAAKAAGCELSEP